MTAIEVAGPRGAASPRDHVEQTLRGQQVGAVPLTAVRSRIVTSDAERHLRNAGLCLVAPAVPPWQVKAPSVGTERVFLPHESGDLVEQTRLRTSEGELSSTVRHSRDRRASFTTERLFKTAADYDPLVALLESQQYDADYDTFERFEAQFGDDVFVRLNLGYTPMHYVMHQLMGLETFADEWSHRREQVLALYQAVTQNHNRRLAVAVESPVRAITYGGHLNAREVGEDRFRRYYLPPYREFADLVHAKEKLAGIHLSGDPRPLVEQIGKTDADYIEGFRPMPGMGVGAARKAWPDMALWVEIPPEVQLREATETTGWVRDVLLHGKGQRVLLEIGTSLPQDRGRETLLAIHAALAAEPG